MDDLSDKTVVVTGGASGIGFATAQRMRKAGATTVICDQNVQAIEIAQTAWKMAGLSVHALVADVSIESDMQRLMSYASQLGGGIDALINNAGVGCSGDAVSLAEAEWSRTIDVNLKGAFLASKYAIPHMRPRRQASIVNVASVHAFATRGARVAYVAAKAGIVGMTRAMALNHAKDGVRVNAVCPGPIDTSELRTGWSRAKPDVPIEQTLQNIGKSLPSGRIGSPKDVANLIAFLCGPHSTFINGADITIDGGARVILAVNPDAD